MATIQGDIITTPADSLGYIKYNSADSLKIDDALFTERDLFYVDAGIGGGAYEGDRGGCNISFGSLLEIDFNLPEFSFEFTSGFDTSLFDKADAISLEFTMMNDMLINTILDMGCCDIAKVYNVTMVPFFQFFADSNNGGFIEMMVRYAEIIAMLRAVIEPLECLIRFVPGNPWLPKDIDFLAWIYGYFKEAKPFLDRVLSGELLDIILNPVHNMRTKMQACLVSGIPPGTTFTEFLEVGSSEQLQAISALAVQDGNQIIDAALPHKPEPKEPRAQDYPGGSTNPGYISDVADYQILKVQYDNYTKYKAEIDAEIQRQAVASQNVNRALAVSSQTNMVIHASTDGLCGCVADALGLNNVSISTFPIRTSDDLYKLEGKTINGLTNKDAGVTSKNRPKDDKYTVESDDVEKSNTQAAIVSRGPAKGQPKKVENEIKIVEVPSGYGGIVPSRASVVRAEINSIATAAVAVSSQLEIMKANDASQKALGDLINQAGQINQEIINGNQEAESNWNVTKKELQTQLQYAVQLANQANGTASVSTLSAQKDAIELEVAQSIYNSYYNSFNNVDLSNDPQDSRAVSNYLLEDEFWGMFPDEYWDVASSLSKLRIEALSPELQRVPFPPNTPPQNIIQSLPLSTDVDVDERFKVNYFNAGFVKEKGSSSWRNFNKLDLVHGEDAITWGAIGRDKSQVDYLAVFPSDAIGDKACLSYIRETYDARTLLTEIAQGELTNDNIVNVEDFLSRMYTTYGFEADEMLMNFSDDDIDIIITEISTTNGYSSGKLWVKTRASDPDLKIDTEYNYIYEGEDFKLQVNGKEVQGDDIRIMAGGDNVALQARTNVNASIEQRAPYYENTVKLEMQNQANAQGVDTIRNAMLNSIASMVPTDVEVLIPCTCQNFLCMLLNAVIQYVLAALNRLIQELINMIIQFLIPDWIKDLLRMILDFASCLGSIFGMAATLDNIHDYAEDLLDAMRDRIRYYPADACFIPNDPFPQQDDDLPGTGYPGDIPGDDNDDAGDGDDAGGGIYLPPGNGGGNGGGDGGGDGGPRGPRDRPDCYNPPVVINDSIALVPGDQGRCVPGLKFKCEYIQL